MYIGHVAVGLASVRARQGVPLWVLLLAAQWPDWVQLSLQALGAWNAQLYSHSIPAILAGGLLFTLVFLRQTSNMSGALLVGLVYLTHPVLDLVTGDKPLWPGGPKIGANWYDMPAKDFAIEVLILLVAWQVWRSTLGARRSDRRVWAMLAALVACQALLDVGQQMRLIRSVGSSSSPSDFPNVTEVRRRRIQAPAMLSDGERERIRNTTAPWRARFSPREFHRSARA